MWCLFRWIPESKEDVDQPLYMCIKIGKKFNLVPGHGGTFVRTRLKAEYWFDIPSDRYANFRFATGNQLTV